MKPHLFRSVRSSWKSTASAGAAALLLCFTLHGQTIPNPGFEADTFTVSPGTISLNSPITGWTASDDTRAGLNPAGDSVYADNGAIPEGNNVAFIMAGTTLSTTISGLTIGTTYKVQFRANATTNQTPNVQVQIDYSQAFPPPTAIPVSSLTIYPAGGTKPYAYVAFEFTAQAASSVMTIYNDAVDPNTLLVDDFRIAPSSGKWSVAGWNDDSDSGVDMNFVYTHAYNFGSAANTIINTIPFTGVAGGNPSVADVFSTTYFANVFNNHGNFVTGGSRTLANDFVYGGNVPAGDFQSITIKGLTSGTEYVATIYCVGFDPPTPGVRWATFSVGEDRMTYNQDEVGNQFGIRFSYRYTADESGTVTLNIAPINAGNVSIHVNGFSNREAVSRNVAPVITSHPKGTTVAEGLPVTFSVAANGIPAPTYQWRFNGADIAGANSSDYTIDAVVAANAGNYDVVVANSMGTLNSSVAKLVVGIPMTNPSFEADVFGLFPGYVSDNWPITAWTSLGNHGINPIADGQRPFADNGAIPHGGYVAFMQGDGALGQVVGGFTVGGEYYLHYYENARNGGTPFLEAKVGDTTVVPAHGVTQVGGSNPYHEIFGDVFTAGAADLEVSFIKSNPLGGDTTALVDNVAFVRVPAGTAPSFTRTPVPQLAQVGQSVTFVAHAIGSLPLNYQWFKDETNLLDGATSPSLMLSALQKPDQGNYSVRVSNASGSVTSAPVYLTVYEPIPDLYNTGVGDDGVALADGLADPHYTLIENADTNSTYAIIQDSSVFPIVAGPWLANTASSKWIGPQFNTVASAVGFYTYRTHIVLEDRDPSTVVIIGGWATDNGGTDIRVNGVSTGNPTSPGFDAYTPFTIYGTNFVAGTNTLDFVVENAGAIGYTGLRIRIDLSNVLIPPGVVPEITAHPVGQTVAVGDSVTFTGAAKGSSPIYFQWLKNGAPIAGETDLTLTLANITTGDAGLYALSASNAAGVAVSQSAQLNVSWQPIPGVFGTGVAADGTLLASGEKDPHYILSASVDPSFPGPDAFVVNEAYPIQPGTWLVNGPKSKWIAPAADQDNSGGKIAGALGGEYTYQTSFDLTGYDLSKVKLEGAWAIDNMGIDIKLNGVSTGITSPGFSSLTPFSITSGFVAGNNTLDFVLTNTASADPAVPNPTAFRADLRALLYIGQPEQPKLQITRDGNTLTITWSPAVAGQKLMVAPDVTGNWSELVGASSPFTTNTTNARLFYRIAP